jgi:hypothetical protein
MLSHDESAEHLGKGPDASRRSWVGCEREDLVTRTTAGDFHYDAKGAGYSAAPRLVC